MNFSAIFIMRPIATVLLILGMLACGLTALVFLPLAALPNIDVPTIRLFAALPGAYPETMATSEAAPLERQLSQIAGLTELTSTSALGSTSVTAQFDLARDINGAAPDVQAAINAAGGTLPKNLPQPPTYQKANPGDFQIMPLAVSSDTLPIGQVDSYADDFVAQRLSRVPGVSLVDLNGEQKPAVRIEVYPEKAASLGLGLEDIRAALGEATIDAPKGSLRGPSRSISLSTTINSCKPRITAP